MLEKETHVKLKQEWVHRLLRVCRNAHIEGRRPSLWKRLGGPPKKWKNGNVQSRRKIALARATDVGALHVLHLIVYLKEMLFAQTLFVLL